MSIGRGMIRMGHPAQTSVFGFFQGAKWASVIRFSTIKTYNIYPIRMLPYWWGLSGRNLIVYRLQYLGLASVMSV